MTAGDSLSPAFISHMKILFDVLDESHTGFVRLGDIEGHWEGNRCMIPSNIVIQCLRNVALPSGHLSFDTFTVGLQRALTLWKSNRTDQTVITHTNDNRGPSPDNMTTHESVYISNDNNSCDSAGQHRHEHRSSAAWNGLLKSNDVCNVLSISSRANVDGLNKWQHEGTLAGHDTKYSHMQKSKGNSNQFIIMPRDTNSPWTYHASPLLYSWVCIGENTKLKILGQ